MKGKGKKAVITISILKLKARVLTTYLVIILSIGSPLFDLSFPSAISHSENEYLPKKKEMTEDQHAKEIK